MFINDIWSYLLWSPRNSLMFSIRLAIFMDVAGRGMIWHDADATWRDTSIHVHVEFRGIL